MNAKSITEVTAPAELAVSLNMVKGHIRIEDTDVDEDALLFGLMRTAVDWTQKYLGRSLVTRTMRLTMDTPPDEPWRAGFKVGIKTTKIDRAIELPYPPLQAVTSIVTYDDADAATTFGASNYFVDTASAPGRVVLRKDAVWPSEADRTANAIEITYTAGYGATMGLVPEGIRQGILMLVGHLYENRDVVEAMSMSIVPMGVKSVLHPYRVLRVSV